MKRFVKEYANSITDYEVLGISPNAIAKGECQKKETKKSTDKIVNWYESGRINETGAIYQLNMIDKHYFEIGEHIISDGKGGYILDKPIMEIIYE